MRLLKLHRPVNLSTRDFSTRDFLACMIEKSSVTSYTSHLFSENQYEIRKNRSMIRNIRTILTTNDF